MCRAGRPWGRSISENTVWHIVKKTAASMNIPQVAPHDLRRSCARLRHDSRGELKQIRQMEVDSTRTQENAGLHFNLVSRTISECRTPMSLKCELPRSSNELAAEVEVRKMRDDPDENLTLGRCQFESFLRFCSK